MLSLFKPTWMVESIYDIKPEQLKAYGIRMVLTDLDNTLIAWNHPDATKESLEWIQDVEDMGIPVVIVSNNRTGRVKKVADMLQLPFVSWAMKPFSRGFKKVMDTYDLDKSELIMVGDQMLTDVLGSNLFGLSCVLVKPLLASDAWNTKLNRWLELKIINYLVKKDPEMEWRDSLDKKIR